MIRWILLLLSLSLLFGCGGNDGESDFVVATTPPTKSVTKVIEIASTNTPTPLPTTTPTREATPVPTSQQANTPAPNAFEAGAIAIGDAVAFAVTRRPTQFPPTPTPAPPTATPTITPVPLGALNFPAWARDRDTDVGLMLSSAENNTNTFTLINAATSEKYSFQKEDVSGYFWVPNRNAIGLLRSNQQVLWTIDIDTNSISIESLPVESTHYLQESDTSSALTAFAVGGDEKYRLFQWREGREQVSENGRIYADWFSRDDQKLLLTDLDSGESWQVPASDGYCIDSFHWSPTGNMLAIREATVDSMLCHYAGYAERLKVYDADQQNVLFTVDGEFRFVEWSLDSTSLWYRRPNALCQLSIGSGKTTSCIAESLVYHAGVIGRQTWSSDQRLLYYLFDDSSVNAYRGGFCVFDIAQEMYHCPTESIEALSDWTMRWQSLSSTDAFTLLVYDEFGMQSDVFGDFQFGILNIKDQTFFKIGSISEFGSISHFFPIGYFLWRPSLEP